MSFCSDHQQEMRQSTFAGKEHILYCPTKGCPNKFDTQSGNYFKSGPRQPRPGAGPGNGPKAASPPGSSGVALTQTQLRLEVLKLAVQSEAIRVQAGDSMVAVEIAVQMMKFVQPVVVAPASPTVVAPPPRRPAPGPTTADETYFARATRTAPPVEEAPSEEEAW